jgi:RsiW-degrading membrane proteinase PrsW (M82 family)
MKLVKDGKTKKKHNHRKRSSARETEHSLNYQSFSNDSSTQGGENTDFRGFSSSISGMYLTKQSERTDCCSVACCGSLQGDRNRYLVQGITPPSCLRRLVLHIFIPGWIFALATFCAVNIPEHWMNEIFSTSFVFLLIAYFVTQCYKGSYKRKLVRKELLWSKHSLLTRGVYRMRPHDEDSTVESFDELRFLARRQPAPDYFMGQTLADVHNAHGLCGCYVNDYPQGVSTIETDENEDNLCRKMFQCYSLTCCRLLGCGRHLQLCGVCATAQEGRELEGLLHPGYHKLDYITMQPILDYYPAIYEARNSSSPGINWWGRLSQLSKDLIRASIICLALLFVWSLLSERVRHAFQPLDFGVFCLTLMQSLLFLTIVRYGKTKDISFDAILKFAVCGFCLCTTMAISFELLVGLSLRLVMLITFQISGIDQIQENSYSSIGESGFANVWGVMDASGGPSSYRDYLHVYGREHPIFYTFYLLFNSFILAAMVEELCKYFGFRMVEHPDLMNQNELELAANCTSQNSSPDEMEDPQNPLEPPSFPFQNRGANSRGNAITVGMVSVALGFACCENLIYIFAYGDQTVPTELFILLLRTLLPVHPIAAALQSIQVCRQELEGAKLGLLRKILPGLIFHGTYDFCLLWIEFLAHRKGNYLEANYDDDALEESANSSDWISLFVGFGVLIGGFLLFFKQSRQQVARLKQLDESISPRKKQYTSPSAGSII